MNTYTDTIKKYAVFDGRATRTEYWTFFIVNSVIALLLGVISSFIMYVFSVALLLPTLAVAVRRLHDTNKSAWWLAVILIPFLGGLIFLFFALQESQVGDNAYGPNPKTVGAL